MNSFMRLLFLLIVLVGFAFLEKMRHEYKDLRYKKSIAIGKLTCCRYKKFGYYHYENKVSCGFIGYSPYDKKRLCNVVLHSKEPNDEKEKEKYICCREKDKNAPREDVYKTYMKEQQGVQCPLYQEATRGTKVYDGICRVKIRK